MQISTKSDLVIIQQQYHVETRYKKKADKVHSANVLKPTEDESGEESDWKKKIYEKLELHKHKKNKMPKNMYMPHIKPKFSGVACDVWLTSERIEQLQIDESIMPQEWAFLLKVLFTRELALMWNWEKKKTFHSEICSSVRVQTVNHKSWQKKNIPISQALKSATQHILQDHMRYQVAEYYDELYCNTWFLVKKKNEDYHLIITVVPLNTVTLKDVNLSSSADEFSEEFSDMMVAFLLDLFSEYDQIELHPESRDLTAFHTFIGLLQMWTVPQEWINAVQIFMCVMKQILVDISEDCDVFLDDISVKGPISRYDEEKVLSEVHCFMFEHLQSLSWILYNIELVRDSVAAEKCYFLVEAMKIVGFVCDFNDWHPEKTKIIKILDWPFCTTVYKVHAFVGTCDYYHVWVVWFVMIADSLYCLC